MPVVALWSMKGGVGVSVLTAALAVAANGQGSGDWPSSLAVDLTGDVPTVIGLTPNETLGVIDWLRATPDDPVDSLRRLTVRPDATAGPGFGVMLRGVGDVEADDISDAAGRFVDALRASTDIAVIDCGQFRGPGPVPGDGSVPSVEQRFRMAVAASADVGWLVSRACYLSARLASHSPVEADGCVVLREAGRTLASSDVSLALDLPLVLDVAVDPRVARVVDCGMLLTRLPTSLQRTMVRSLRRAV